MQYLVFICTNKITDAMHCRSLFADNPADIYSFPLFFLIPEISIIVIWNMSVFILPYILEQFIEAAKFYDEYDMDMDIADLDLSIIDDTGKESVHYCRSSDEKSSTPFSDKLKPTKINTYFAQITHR